MNKSTFLALALSSLTLATSAQTLVPTSSADQQLSLNGTWHFHFEGSDAANAPIRVPGNWDMQGFATPVYAKGSKAEFFTAEHPAHTGVYTRTVNVPKSWKGQQVFIAFDGVENGYQLSVNGKTVGAFRSAFNRSMQDITPFIKYGKENQLTVIVPQNGSKGWEFDTNDDWVYGGITRDVTLYALPKVHFTDVTLSTHLAGGKALLSVSTSLLPKAPETYPSTTTKTKMPKGLTIAASLIDADGQTVTTTNLLPEEKGVMTVNKPSLWTAETPTLYTLQLQLMKGKKLLQTYTTKVGLREVTWKDGTFRVNGQAIKLLGMNHHDESPVNGRAETEAEFLQDLRMMKAANVNAIRTCHYPPSPHFMDMCDSLGFYVFCEVPFGFGDENLSKKDYLEVLKERAWYTVNRDKNRPSVVVWNVGNENPNTRNGFVTASYVERLDPTRPHLFPQTIWPFKQIIEKYNDSISILSRHYPAIAEVRRVPDEQGHIIANTEYAHALGLDFGSMQDIVEGWYTNPRHMGGAVWGWADQAIVRHDKHLTNPYEATEYVWKDDHTYYDMEGDLGTDGVVYPDRTPQTDYWQVKAVYSPVKATLTDDYQLQLINRYDFTNLNTLRCRLQLYNQSQLMKEETLTISLAPHATTVVPLMDEIKQFAWCDTCVVDSSLTGYLRVTFTNRQGHEVYANSFPLNVDHGFPNTRTWELIDERQQPTMTAEELKTFIATKVRVRMGKKPTLSQKATMIRDTGKKHHLWDNYLVEPTSITVKRVKPKHRWDASNCYEANVRFIADSTRYVDARLWVTQEPFAIDYELKVNTRDSLDAAVEAGLSILTGMKSSDATLHWMGRGPYANYPGRDALAPFGVYQLNGDDLYFPGNRRDVQIAALTDKTGAGLAIIPLRGDQNCKANDSACGGDICVERDSTGQILLSHNAWVASPFNKNVWPQGTLRLHGASIRGAFELVRTDGNWSPALRQLLGEPTAPKETFRPFYNSYDQ